MSTQDIRDVPVRTGHPDPTTWHLAQLIDRLDPDDSAEAYLLVSTNPPDTAPTVSSIVVTVHNPIGSTLDASRTVWIAWHPQYQRWCVLGTACSPCVEAE